MPPVIRTTKTAPQANRLGEAAKPNPLQNCMSCAMFVSCRDPKKNHRYRCTRWKEMPQLDGGGGLVDLLGRPMEPVKPAKGAKAAPGKKAAQQPPVKAKRKGKSIIELDDLDDNGEPLPKAESEMLAMIRKSMASDSLIPPDFLLQDGDIPEAGNFWQWMTLPEFGNNHTKLYPKQFEVMMKLEGCYCPRCSDPKWIIDIPFDTTLDEVQDHIVLLDRGVCPQCNVKKSELVASGELNEYYSLYGIVGQRSGKTYSAALFENYMIHRWLKCPDPQRLMGVGSGQILTGTYVALTFEQIQKNFMEPLNSFIRETPWFLNYHSFLDDAAERLGAKELYNHATLFAKYSHRKLLFAAASANKRTLRGATRVTSIVDEADWFPFGKLNEGKERATGEEVYTALNNSMATIMVAHEVHVSKGMNFAPKPYISLISSPQDINGMVMAMSRDAQGSRTVYTYKHATWEFNPTIKRNSAFIEAAYRVDAIKAERDFGANPPLSSAGWIVGTGNVFPLFTGDPNPVVTRQYTLKSPTLGVRRTGVELIKCNASFSAGRVLVLDASEVNNSFAWMVVSKDDESEKIHVDAMGEIQPSKDAPIAWERLYDSLFVPLCENLGVQAVISDHWQSASVKQRLEEELDVAPFTYRLKYQDFVQAKAAFYDRKIVLPSLGKMNTEERIFNKALAYPKMFLGEPEAHLFHQILSVREIVGKKVEKGPGLTDDLFRVMILAHYAMQQEEILELLGDGEAEEEDHGDIGLVISAGRGGGNRANLFGSVTSLPKIGNMGAVGSKAASREGASGRGSFIGTTSSMGKGR